MSLQNKCVDLFVQNLKNSPEVIQELIGEELINRLKEDITKDLKKKIYDDIVNNVSCIVSESLMNKTQNTLQHVDLCSVFTKVDKEQVELGQQITNNILLEFEDRFLPQINTKYCDHDDFDDYSYDEQHIDTDEEYNIYSTCSIY